LELKHLYLSTHPLLPSLLFLFSSITYPRLSSSCWELEFCSIHPGLHFSSSHQLPLHRRLSKPRSLAQRKLVYPPFGQTLSRRAIAFRHRNSPHPLPVTKQLHHPHSAAHIRLPLSFTISDPTSCVLIYPLAEHRRATFTIQTLLTAQHGAAATAAPAAAATAAAAAAAIAVSTACFSAAAPGWRRPWACWTQTSYCPSPKPF
jgi:hypothetical protein